MTTIYVSNTAANGIGVGNDTTGNGMEGNPYQTLGQALSVAQQGDTIILNNGTYASTSGSFDITQGVTIDSVVPGGATIQGTGGQPPLAVDITNGGTLTLGAVNIDAQNTVNDILLGSESTTYTLTLSGTQLLNATGYAIAGQANAQVNVSASNVVDSANDSLGMLGLSSLAAGNIDIQGGSVSIADQQSGQTTYAGEPGSGSIGFIDATTSNVSVTVAGVLVNATMDTSDALGSGLTILNVANAIVEHNAITLYGQSGTAYGVDVSYDLTDPLNSSGAMIENNAIDNFNTGGTIITVGFDGSPGQANWGYADNATITGNTGMGDAASQAADLHGILVGWQSGTTVSNNTMEYTALPYVIKGDFGTTLVSDNLDIDTSARSWYQKAGMGVEWLDNASYQQEGYRPVGLYVGPDPDNPPGYSASGGTAIGNTVWYEGPQASGHFVYVAPGNSIQSLSDDYYHSDGPLNAAAWYLQGTFINTLAQWQNIEEPTASAPPGDMTFSQFIALLSEEGGYTVGAPAAVANVSVSAGTTLPVGADLTYAGGLSEAGGSTVTISNGDTLTLTDSSDVYGTVGGAGTLAEFGGTLSIDDGATLTVSHWSLTGADASVTVGENVIYSGNFTAAAQTVVNISNGDTLLLGGTASLSGSVSGAGALALAGNTTFNGGAVILAADASISGTGTTVTIAGDADIGAVLNVGTGTTTNIFGGDTLTLTGTASLAGDVTGSGTLAIVGGEATIFSGAQLSVGAFTLAGDNTTATFVENLAYSGSFDAGADTIVGVDSGDTLGLGGATTLGGSVSGAGTLLLADGGDTTIAGGAVLSVATTSMSESGTTASVIGNASITGAFSQGTGAIVEVASGDTLTLQGLTNLDGYVEGAGTLALDGGTATIGNGAQVSIGNLSVQGSDTMLSVAESVAFAGSFSVASSSNISIGDGDTLTLTGATNLAGSVGGLGTLSLAGAATIASGAEFSVSGWSILGNDTTVTLGEDISYSGTFSEAAGDTLNLIGGNAELSGNASFAGGTVAGSQRLYTEGTTSVSGLTIAGTASLQNSGSLTQSGGNLAVGRASSDQADLYNTATGTYAIADDSGISASASSFIENAGLFEKTGGAGVSTIAASFTDSGTINVASGTLSFVGPTTTISGAVEGAGSVVFGSGSVALQGGTTMSIANVTVSGAATTASVAENLTMSSDFSEGVNAIVDVAMGATLTLTGTANLNGSVASEGRLALNGGTTTLGTGAQISVSGWSIAGNGTTVRLAESLSYSGTFSEGASATLSLIGGNAALSGNASFAGGMINGSQRLYTEGTTAIAGLTIAGTASLENTGALIQSGGNVAVGQANGDKAELYNASTGTYAIADDSGISASASSFIDNAGLFEKTGGAGVSTIAASLTDTGTIKVASGTLSFTGAATTIAGALEGAGSVVFGGGSVALQRGATLSTADATVYGAGTRLAILESLNYSGDLGAGADTLVDVAGGDTLKLTGIVVLSGSVEGAGTLALAGRAMTIDSGAKISISRWSVSGGGTTVTLDESLSYSGTFSEGAGDTLSLIGGSAALSGHASFAGGMINGSQRLYTEGTTAIAGLTIAGTASLENTGALTQSGGNVAVGQANGDKAELYNASTGTYAIADDSGISASASSFIDNAGLFEKTGGAGVSTIATSLTDTGTIKVASGTLSFVGPTTSVAGAVEGAGSVVFGSGSVALQGGTTMSIANVTVSGATLAVQENLTYGGVFDESTKTAIDVSNYDTLTLRGATTLAGDVGGAGTLVLTGGGNTTLDDAVVSVADMSLSDTTASATGNVRISSQFSESAGAVVDVSSGSSLALSGAASLSGLVKGAGTLEMSGATAIDEDARLSVSVWSISGKGATVTLDEALDYSGAFHEDAGTTLDLAGGNIAFSGPTNLAGTIDGSHRIFTTGTTSLSALTLDGAASLDNAGTLIQSGGNLVAGGASSGTFLLNDSTGVYDIAENSGIVAPAASSIDNAGLFEKTGGSGISLIAAALTNSGTVKVVSGTLAFRGPVSGDGKAIIEGASTLELDSKVASGQTVSFAGKGGELILGDLKDFAGEIGDFGAHDTIAVAGSFTVKGFTENGAHTQGTLELAHGSTEISIVLLGQYMASNFATHAGPDGTTLITYTAAQDTAGQLAPAH